MKAPFHSTHVWQQNPFFNQALGLLLPLPPEEGRGEGSPTPPFSGGFPLPAPSPQPSPTGGRGSKKTLQTMCVYACPHREKRPTGNPGAQVNKLRQHCAYLQPNQPKAHAAYEPAAIKSGAKP